MSLHKLLPNSAKNKNKKSFDALLQIILVEWGWSYRDFQDTPVSVILVCLREWEAKKTKEQQRLKNKK